MQLRAIIDQHKMSHYQWLIVLMTTLMNLLDGFDVFAVAFTASAIKTEFALDSIKLGYLLSAGLFGMAAGSLFLAPLADKIGRRPLLLIAISLSTLGMLASAFVSDFSLFIVWRALTGLGVGGVLVSANVLTSEYANGKWRSLAISIYTAGFSVGAVLGGSIAVFLQEEYGWRSVFFMSALLAILCWVFFWFLLPESLEFLLKQNNSTSQTKLNLELQKMGLRIDTALENLSVSPSAVQQKNSPLALLSHTYIRSTLAIWTAFFTIAFSFYFVTSWTPTLLKEAGMSLEQSVVVGIMITLGGSVGALLYGVFASRWAARQVMFIFTLLSASAVVIFVLSSNALLLAMIFGVLVGALINGCISGVYTLSPSLYGAEIRNTGVGWTVGIGRIGAILAPIVAGMLLEQGWDKQSLYLGVSMILGISALAVFILPTQTTK